MTHKRAHAQPQKTPIYVRGRSHPIGYVQGGVFYKTVRTNHFLKRPPALCFERSNFADIEAAGGTSCHFTHVETGDIYTCDMATVRRWGFPVNRGYGDQIALALTRFAVNGRPVAATFESNAAIQAAQPALFEFEGVG